MSHPDFVDIGTPLTRTIEECSELIKALCKVDRFGWYGYNPLKEEVRYNIDIVKYEIDDVLDVIKELLAEMKEIENANT